MIIPPKNNQIELYLKNYMKNFYDMSIIFNSQEPY